MKSGMEGKRKRKVHLDLLSPLSGVLHNGKLSGRSRAPRFRAGACTAFEAAPHIAPPPIPFLPLSHTWKRAVFKSTVTTYVLNGGNRTDGCSTCRLMDRRQCLLQSVGQLKAHHTRMLYFNLGYCYSMFVNGKHHLIICTCTCVCTRVQVTRYAKHRAHCRQHRLTWMWVTSGYCV